MSQVDVPASKRLKTSNLIDSSKQDVDTNSKVSKETDLAPGVSQMIDQAIVNNTIPLANLPPWLELSE